MNWGYIVSLATAVFGTQFVLGVADGFLAPDDAGAAWEVGAHALSFISCGIVFAIFALREVSRPFTHAWIALVTYLLAGFAFAQAIEPWAGSTPLAAVAMGLLVVTASQLFGTSLGLYLRHQAG
ncbi:MAG: hypothetical protein K0M64_02915 [Rhizobium sp.]|nr:hypothetical protein [Rhizobium sp.]